METILNSQNISYDDCLEDEEICEKIVFLLTKPPNSERAKLCFRLIEGSKVNSVLYLAEDGVFNLLSHSIDLLPQDHIFACKEDVDARMDSRGMQSESCAILLVDFYGRLVEDIMVGTCKVYTF